MLRPSSLYTVAQCRHIEQTAIAQGTDAYQLMCRAAKAALDLLLNSWALPEHIHIVCGTGNNGGDGLALARLAKQRGLAVSVYLLGDEQAIVNEARQAFNDAQAAGVTVQTLNNRPVPSAGIIVDALIGIGLKNTLRASSIQAINWINQAQLPVLSLDVPSGLCADTGAILGAAVKADKTLSFIVAKRGLFSHQASTVCGEILLDTLGIGSAWIEQAQATIEHHALSQLLRKLPPRPNNAHKGLFGHVLIVGGDYGMAGAAMMAAEAAARAGAGLVSVATQKEHLAAMLSRRPEIMVHGVVSGQELEPLLEKPDVIVIGPGLGQTPWSEQMLQKVLACSVPVVIDADALNLLSQPAFAQLVTHNHWVLTPHPGEAARLLNSDSQSINNDRFAAVAALQQRFGGVAVLKGAGSLISDGQRMALCSYGNPGMASGGMGDVLSGLIAGLLAQGLRPFDATTLAVSLHAKAADLVAQEYGQHGLLATDLFPYLRYLINGKY